MADEYSDRFQSEVMRSLQKLVEKSIEHDKRFDNVEAGLKRVGDDLKVLSSQLNDVGVLAIKDSGRIDDHEKRISDLEANIH